MHTHTHTHTHTHIHTHAHTHTQRERERERERLKTFACICGTVDRSNREIHPLTVGVFDLTSTH